MAPGCLSIRPRHSVPESYNIDTCCEFALSIRKMQRNRTLCYATWCNGVALETQSGNTLMTLQCAFSQSACLFVLYPSNIQGTDLWQCALVLVQHSAVQLGDQAADTMIWYPTQSHYPDSVQTSPFSILLIQSGKLGSDKFKFGKPLAWLNHAPNSQPSTWESLRSTDSATGLHLSQSVLCLRTVSPQMLLRHETNQTQIKSGA